MPKTETAFLPSPPDSPTAGLWARLAELKGRLVDLCQRLPAHSAPPSMVAQMEELEDQIARLEQMLTDHPERAA